MDCMRTQEILSQAADRAPVDAMLLKQAKEHCASCADCAGFVRGLARLHKSERPHMSDAALSALIATARQEAERVQANLSASAARVESDATDEAAEAAALEALRALEAERTPQRTRLDFSRLSNMPLGKQAVVGTVLAAAILFVGIVSVAGMSYLLRPMGADQLAESDGNYIVEDSEQSATAPFGGALDAEAPLTERSTDDPTSSEMATVEEALIAPDYLTYRGWVYEYIDPATNVALTDLVAADTVRSDLGEGVPSTHPVWLSNDPTNIYVQADNDQLLEFELVYRWIEGVRCALRSRDMDTFGTWPTLPAGIPEPTRDDGSPTFAESGTDSEGVPIYPLASSDDVSNGAAIAPYTQDVEASKGNPSWTWWEPFTTP